MRDQTSKHSEKIEKINQYLYKLQADQSAQQRELDAKNHWLEKQQEAMDARNQMMNWLWSIGGVFVALVTLAITKLVSGSERSRMQAMLSEGENTLQQMRNQLEQTETHAATTAHLAGKAKKELDELLRERSANIQTESTDQQKAKVKAAADPDQTDLSFADTLRAKALAARDCDDWQAAIHYWLALVEQSPDDASLQFNIAYGNHELSDRADGKEKRTLLQKAITHYQQSLEINPKNEKAHCNWGNALLGLAQQASGAKQTNLYQEAITHYQQALEINSKYDSAHSDWGNALSGLARQASGGNQSDLYADAIEHCLVAEKLKLGSGSYNLTCVYAQQGDTDAAQHWLSKCLKHGYLPDCDHLNLDSDLDNLRDLGWFKAFMAEHCDEVAM